MRNPVRLLIAGRVTENLRAARRRQGISQETLAFLAGLHRTEIGKLENRERLPGIETVVKLATVLEIPVDQLVDGVIWEPPRSAWERGRFVVAGSNPKPSSP